MSTKNDRIKIFVITSEDLDYIKELELRNEILRKPLGRNLFAEQLKEDDDFHIIAKQEDEVIGCCVLTKIDNTILKMRQVAVNKSMQGYIIVSDEFEDVGIPHKKMEKTL